MLPHTSKKWSHMLLNRLQDRCASTPDNAATCANCSPAKRSNTPPYMKETSRNANKLAEYDGVNGHQTHTSKLTVKKQICRALPRDKEKYQDCLELHHMKGSMNMNRATRRHNLYIIPIPLGRVSSQWRGAPVFKFFKNRMIRDAVVVIIFK